MNQEDFYISDHPRSTVQLLMRDGRVISGLRGALLESFAKAVQSPEGPMIVGAVLAGNLRELTFPVLQEADVQWVTLEDADGARIYRRSLTFLLEVAFNRCYPEAVLTIDHSVSSGGYYCQVTNLEKFDQQDLDRVTAEMQALVAEDIPFVREVVPLTEAIDYFKSIGEDDKVRLLKYRQRKDLVLYRADDRRDYHHGYLVPSSGYLKWFDLILLDHAFIVRFPRRQNPSELMPMVSYPNLLKTFREYSDWLNKLGIQSVGALNDAIQEGHIDEVILVSEALHEMQISSIAEQIYRKREKVGAILIAGPSSSGKTTFSKRLSIQLLARGITPYALEMDNYFIDRAKTPLKADGTPDFESLRALS